MNDIDSTPAAPRPWWKHGYVWLVIAGPAAVVVAGIATVVDRRAHADPVVADGLLPPRHRDQQDAAPRRSKALLPALQGRNHAATPGPPLMRPAPKHTGTRRTAWGNRMMWIAWPAFLAACALELLVFALVDPANCTGPASAWAGRGRPCTRGILRLLGRGGGRLLADRAAAPGAPGIEPVPGRHCAMPRRWSRRGRVPLNRFARRRASALDA